MDSTPLDLQRETAQAIGYKAIWLRREGDYVLVLVEDSIGEWVEVIREHHDGQYSHIVEPRGIEERLKAHA
jgi:hypothetical protein